MHQEASLKAIELDLEDERHPRINVAVQLDNKVTKHILYQPSHMVLHIQSRLRGVASSRNREHGDDHSV